MLSNDAALGLDLCGHAFCADCLYEHYQCVKNRDLDRWKSHLEQHPNHYKKLQRLEKLKGIEVLDIFCDLARSPSV